MNCPNKCGELIKIEKPTEVFIDTEIYSFISSSDIPSVEDTIIFCQQIHIICPKCGYYEVEELTENEWNKMNESIGI